MGLLWDLIQQSEISAQREKAHSLEQRVEDLEHELGETRALLRSLLVRLENYLNEDLDRDGRVG